MAYLQFCRQNGYEVLNSPSPVPTADIQNCFRLPFIQLLCHPIVTSLTVEMGGVLAPMVAICLFFRMGIRKFAYLSYACANKTRAIELLDDALVVTDFAKLKFPFGRDKRNVVAYAHHYTTVV